MNDSNYINFYIDTMVGTLNENTLNIIKLKTQISVLTSIGSQKDEEIQKLNTQIQQQNVFKENYKIETENTEKIKKENEELRNKVLHLDSAIQQIIEMKNIIRDKDCTIEKLKTELKQNESMKESEAKRSKSKKRPAPLLSLKKEENIIETVNDF